MAAGRERQRAMWPIYANSIQNHVGAQLADADADLLTELLDRVTPEDPTPTPEGELA